MWIIETDTPTGWESVYEVGTTNMTPRAKLEDGISFGNDFGVFGVDSKHYRLHNIETGQVIPCELL